MKIINDNEFKDLKYLLCISRMVEDLYEKLYNLEINNQKESLEYNRYLEYLKMVLDMENEAYLKLDLNDYDKISRYLMFIDSTYNLTKDTSDLKSVIRGDYEKRIVRRLVAKITYNIPHKSEFIGFTFHDEIRENIKEMINETMLVDEDINNYVQDFNNVNNNLYIMFLNIVYQAYLDKNNSFIKEDLLKTYYNLIYLNPSLELKMLDTKFSVPSISDIASLNEEEKIIARKRILPLSFDLLDTLLYVSDEEFSYHAPMRAIVVLNCLLESCLYLLEEHNFEIVYNYYLDTINDLDYKQKYADDKICKGIVLNSFNLVKSAKEKPNALELKQ